jgi:hypothetical protein
MKKLMFAGQPADGGDVWWLWVVGGLVAWFVLASAFALLIGRSVRFADLRSSDAGRAAALSTLEAPDLDVAVPPVRQRRRAVPLPSIGVALAAAVVAVETAAYVVRLTGTSGAWADLLATDAPLSLPRLFVASLFAVAALAAVAGARVIPGRRTWWLAVGVVAAGIAVIHAVSTVHADAFGALHRAIGAPAAVLVSGLVAGGVIGALALLSRSERRDRRRILGVLALYSGGAVGLAGLTSLTTQTYGAQSSLAAAAAFLQGAGASLAGVAFLMAVLVGVAPRLVLPARWALRRQVDAHTLDVPAVSHGHSAPGGASAR